MCGIHRNQMHNKYLNSNINVNVRILTGRIAPQTLNDWFYIAAKLNVRLDYYNVLTYVHENNADY
jgi:L-rhamnose isomerase